MVKNNNFANISKKIFLIIITLIIAIIFFVGAKGNVYLFDSSIVYEYGYLISKGYRPFFDFSTPLLPLIGYIQYISFEIFGFNYNSGIYASFSIVMFQFFILFYLLYKIIDYKTAITFSFLVTIGGMPMIGNLYYNHFLVSIASISFLIMYFEIKSNNKNLVVQIIKFVLIFIILLIKIHWGIFLLLLQFIFDLTYSNKKILNIFKFYVWGILFFIFFSFILFKITNNARILDFYYFSKKIKFSSNINYIGVLHLIINFPKNIFSTIELNPVSIFLIFIIPLFLKNDLFVKKIKLELFIILEIVFFSIFTSINSAEVGSVLIPLQFIILFLILIHVREELPYTEQFRIKYIIFFLLSIHIIFSIISVIYGSRKVYDETNGQFSEISTSLPAFSKRNLISNSQEVNYFFKGVKLTDKQIISFNFVDSILKQNTGKHIFFGPELEILNVVYNNNPLRGFPLWVHPGLTVPKSELKKLEMIFENNLPDIIFISRKRESFLPFINDNKMEENNYHKFEDLNNKNFIFCYLKNNNSNSIKK